MSQLCRRPPKHGPPSVLDKLHDLEQSIEHSIEHSLHTLASPKRGHTFWGMVLTVAVVFGLLWLRHGEWLREPNAWFIGESLDGIKNYMTTAWHVERDTTFVHHGGMNYPYGEHTLFTDDQPIFAAALQWWHRNISPLDGRTAECMNWLLVASVLLGAAFLFLLFRKLHLPVWCAGAATVGMAFLTPQYGRFDGHFGLSHTFVFTALLYFLCDYEARRSRRYNSLLIGITIWFSAQLHFYYFGMAALFLSFYTAFQILRERSWSNLRVRAAHWAVMILMPFAALNLWLHWADYAADRTASPYGFSTYIGAWQGVFLPYENWLSHRWLSQIFGPLAPVDGEAKAYAGAVAGLCTLFVLGLAAARFAGRARALFQKTSPANLPKNAGQMFPAAWDDMAHHRVRKHYLAGIFAAAAAVLLFACGVPFAVRGLEWTADWMGPLRQFRGLGRFTWIYFYVANVLAVYLAWHHSRRLAPGRFAWLAEGRRLVFAQNLLVALPLALLCWEAFYFQKTKKVARVYNPMPRESRTQLEEMQWLKKVDFSQFQAVLPLPYYHIGSENVWLDPDYNLFRLTQYTAFLTRLPDMGVNMSRTSLGQTIKSVQLSLPPCEPPAILADLPDERPIALFVLAEKWDEAQQRHAHLLARAKTVYTGANVRVLSLAPADLLAETAARAEAIFQDMSARPLAAQPGSAWLTRTPEGPFFYDSCDSLAAKHTFQGAGARAGKMLDTTWLYRGAWPKGEQMLSFWCRATTDLALTHELHIAENSAADGHEIARQTTQLHTHLKTIVGEWGLIEIPFELREPGSRLSVFLQKEGVENFFSLDEIMLRPRAAEVFRRAPGWVAHNNWWFRR